MDDGYEPGLGKASSASTSPWLFRVSRYPTVAEFAPMMLGILAPLPELEAKYARAA